LRRRADFDRVFQHGRHNSARLMAVRSVANEQPLTRFGYAIPKRVGNAVVRNQIRRRLREILRLLPLREGFDVVITLRQESAQATFHNLRTELITLLRRARLLDLPNPPPGPRP
jgi:ribonuclease P protein component